MKEFWKLNKQGFMWSCISVTLVSFFIMFIKDLDVTATSIFILCSFPVMFLMALGISFISEGKKE